MVWVMRMLGALLIERLAAPIVFDMIAGNGSTAGPRVRRMAKFALLIGGVFFAMMILVAVLFVAVLIRLMV